MYPGPVPESREACRSWDWGRIIFHLYRLGKVRDYRVLREDEARLAFMVCGIRLGREIHGLDDMKDHELTEVGSVVAGMMQWPAEWSEVKAGRGPGRSHGERTLAARRLLGGCDAQGPR